MHLHTLSAIVSAPRDTIFNFLADIENLPRWAPSLCERLYLSRGRWMALSPQGEMQVDLEANNGTGVIDLRAGPSVDRMTLLPVRVLPLSTRSTLVTVTFVPAPEWPAGIMQCDVSALTGELQGLLRRFGGGEICAADPVPQFAELGVN
jgi:uncharacterized membrane protein